MVVGPSSPPGVKGGVEAQLGQLVHHRPQARRPRLAAPGGMATEALLAPPAAHARGRPGSGPGLGRHLGEQMGEQPEPGRLQPERGRLRHRGPSGAEGARPSRGGRWT